MHKVLIIFFLVFSTTNFFPQKENSSNGYFVIKANAGAFYDYELNRFKKANPNYRDVNKYRPPNNNIVNLNQVFNKPFIFPGAEISYYMPRDNFFGLNIGIAYSYDITYYSLYSRFQNGNIRTIGSGYGNLKNNMIKFVCGFNFNSKSGFNFHLQPLNPEIRSIKDGKSLISYSTYDITYSKPIFTYGASGAVSLSVTDSLSTLISTEVKSYEYRNYQTGSISISFPTLVGIEKKFRISKIDFVAGISAAFSILESSQIYRVHFGICLGNFKRLETQPGY